MNQNTENINQDEKLSKEPNNSYNDYIEKLKNYLTPKELKNLELELKNLKEKEKIEKLQIIINSQEKINEFKKNIEKNNINHELLKAYIELVQNIEPVSNRPMFLSGIFGGFKKMGIIYELNGDKIKLSPGKRKEVTQEFTRILTQLETTFNSSGIKKEIILKSFLYSSSGLDSYINSKGKQEYNIDEYVLFLLESYPLIRSKVTYENNPGNNNGDKKGITINVKNEEEYKSLRENIKKDLLNNHQDVIFILTYLDDIYYNQGKNKNIYDIKEYKETVDETEKKFLKAVNELNEEQQAILGVTNPSKLNELKNMATHNPMELLQEGLKNKGHILGLVLGIFGAIFGGWKGFLGRFGIGFLGATLGYDGIKELFNKGKDKISNLGEKSGKESDNLVSNTSGKNEVKEIQNSIYKKYKGLFEGDGETEKLQLWEDLSENEKFLNAEATILNIFETETDETKIKEELKKVGIEITDDNKAYYKDIFLKILNDRKNNIGDIKQNEKIKEYLERTSTNINVVKPPKTNENEYSEEQKKEILTYFNLHEKDISEIESELKLLNLNIYKLLNSYKKFIENNLTGLDKSILDKIKLSITKKLGFIIGEINTLREDDYYKTDFVNNRWIINSKIQDIFSEINNKILPSAYILAKYDEKNNYTKEQKEKIDRIRQMFNSELTESGEFDKNFWSGAGFGEILDTSINNWEVYDITDKDDLAFLEKNGFKKDELGEISLLNEADIKLEKEAQMWFLATVGVLVANDIASFSGIWTIPGIAIGAGYSLRDFFTKEDLAFKILKGTGLVPEEYRTEQKIWERIVAGISVIPGIRTLSKGLQIAKIVSKMKPEELNKFKKMQDKIKDILRNGFKGGNKINVIEGVNSTHIKFFRNEETGATYTQTMDGKFFNSKGKELKRKPKNIKEIDVNNTVNSVNNAENTSIFKRGLEKFNTFSENRFITKQLKNLKPGETINIGDLKIEKLQNGNYRITKGNDIFDELKLKQVQPRIGELDIKLKHDFVLKQKEIAFLSSKIGQQKIINGHKVTIEEGGKIKVLDKNNKLLTPDEVATFRANNVEEFTSKFYGLSIKEAGVKVKDGFIKSYNKLGLKTIGDYLDKAGYSNGQRSKIFSKQMPDALGGILLTPATTIRQLISAIPNKEWENIARIMIGGNKNLPIFGYSGEGIFRLFNSGIGRAGGTILLTNMDDFFEADTSTGDEIGDYAFYMFGGIFYTILAKYIGVID